MYRKRNLLRIFVGVSLLVTSFWLSSCKDEDEEIDTTAPSYFIQESESVIIPGFVAVSASASRVATFYATGVQKYKAQVKAGSDPVTYEWVFVAPQADLYNSNNELIGTHFAGPSWKITATGDLIMGQAYATPKAVNVDPKSIDWLLLMVKTGTTSTGMFADVDNIQRIATTGGRIPTTPPATAEATVEVPYTAVYRFTKE